MTKHRYLPALFFLLALANMPASAQQDAYTLLERVQSEYGAINDYRVEVEATVDMQGLSVPKMTATMYYKKPDKVHIESEGFAMLPRDAVGFHPDMFEKEQYDAVIQGEETIQGAACVKLKLLARSDSLRLQRATLFIDPARNVVLRMDADPGEGAAARADFTYNRVQGKYWLPKTIAISMSSPMHFRRPSAKKKTESDSGKATINLKYKNYVVNKGISDSVFKKDQ